jgi:Flp pilus assembly protein TadG
MAEELAGPEAVSIKWCLSSRNSFSVVDLFNQVALRFGKKMNLFSHSKSQTMKLYDGMIAGLSGSPVRRINNRTDRFRRTFGHGQSMVEFALIVPLVLAIMLIGIQFALIGQAALAVSQAAYLGARAASVDGTLTSGTLSTQISSQISPTISGASVTLTPGAAASCGSPRTFGCPITVSVTYDASGRIFLPTNLLPGVAFPSSLTFTETAMTE